MGRTAAKRVRIQKATPRPPVDPDDVEALRAICVILQSISQRHVPITAIADRVYLAQCLRAMRNMNIDISVKQPYRPMLEASPIDKTTQAYRELKTRAVAALSTVADLDVKSTTVRHTDYTLGMQTAYQKARGVALKFLADIQREAEDQYAYDESDALLDCVVAE
jgi:hypothetical protein